MPWKRPSRFHPERHARKRGGADGACVLQEGRCGDQLPRGRGTRNLLLSNSDSNAGLVPTAKPQCKPPGIQL